jgi:hypothetical protein
MFRDESDRHPALAHRWSNHPRRSGSDIPDREHTGTAGFDQEWLAIEVNHGSRSRNGELLSRLDCQRLDHRDVLQQIRRKTMTLL